MELQAFMAYMMYQIREENIKWNLQMIIQQCIGM